jgi:hypothetical protein
MSEDLSSFELDQIDLVESKYHEISKKNSEKIYEEKFKEVALAITQLYTSVGNHRGPEAYSAFNYAACKLSEFYNEIKDILTFLKWITDKYELVKIRQDIVFNCQSLTFMIRIISNTKLCSYINRVITDIIGNCLNESRLIKQIIKYN